MNATAKISEAKTVFDVEVTLSSGEIHSFSVTATDKPAALGMVIEDLTAMASAIQDLVTSMVPPPPPAA